MPPGFVEFLGPSGVGKTAVARELLQLSALPLASTADTLKARDAQRHHLPAEVRDAYRHLLQLKTEEALRNPPDVPALRVLTFHLTVATQDLRILTASPPGTTVLRDEGFLHNFAGELLHCFKNGPDMSALLARRSAVLFNATEEVIFHRVKTRRAEREPHAGMTDEQLAASIRKKNRRARKLAAALKARGVPVLTLNAAGPADELAPHVEKFLRSVLS